MTALTPRVRLLAAAATIAFAVLAFTVQPFDPFGYGGDIWVYLAAGERLNDGHALYALGPLDRSVPLNPPYWTTPLLAPPPVAVLWRPLAAISPLGPALWWATGVVAIGAMTTDLLRRGGPIALIGTVILAPALALTAASGNATAIITPLLYRSWRSRHHPGTAGASTAFATSLKLTPGILAIWLLVHRRRELAVAVIGGILAIVVSVLGAGIQAHLDWLATSLPVEPAPLSVAGLTGLPSLVVTALAVGVVALVGLARRERATFAAAVIAATIATPAFYVTALAGLAAALAADEG